VSPTEAAGLAARDPEVQGRPAAAVRRRPGPRQLTSTARRLVGAASILLFLVSWELAGRLGAVNPRTVSSPSAVARELPWLVTGGLGQDYRVTALAVAVAFVGSLVVGSFLGVASGRHAPTRWGMDPIVTLGYTTPLVAFVPIVVLFLGLGVPAKIVAGFVGGVFPVIVNVEAGARTVDPVLLRAARSFGVTGLRRVCTVLLPSTAPFVLVGARIALGRVLIGVIITEMIGGSQYGVGLLLIRLGQGFQADRLMALVLLVGLAGTTVIGIIRRLEARILRWRP